MHSTLNISRRQALKRSLVMPLMAGLSSVTTNNETYAASRGTKALVAYFSRTGNTRLIATQIARALDATLFQIVPKDPYPEDYEEQVAQAENERRRGYEPPMQSTVSDVQSYEAVFLGFPIWGTTAPSVIRSFLSQHDLSGKALVPFITHGGYGLGNSLAVLAEHAPRARIMNGFSKRCDQEREILTEVTQWLGSVKLVR
jgi:flavodoxin